MSGCGHTAEEHQAEIRALLRKHQPDLAAWLEGDQVARIAIAAVPWQPLDPKPAPISSMQVFPKIVEDDWTESDEQDWMNELRTQRYRETGR